MKLVVGAKADQYPGWVSTDARAASARLDIRRGSDWLRYFRPDSLSVILAEHVLEHLTPQDAYLALCNFKHFLQPGGFARIAVPDAFYPNEAYQAYCAPGRWGQRFFESFVYAADEPAHRVHYNYLSLSLMISYAGLVPRPCEWHDARGRFHRVAYDVEAAPVKRRAGSEYAINFYRLALGFDNISLIVDAIKPTR
jgi:predicted SAM-dependent methyltransferase